MISRILYTNLRGIIDRTVKRRKTINRKLYDTAWLETACRRRMHDWPVSIGAVR